MMTLHPSGIPHGPHPKALKNAAANCGKEIKEVAVMIDTRESLDVAEAAQAVEWTEYVNSWK
jgi:homogentisate 1,2-dioxygenase